MTAKSKITTLEKTGGKISSIKAVICDMDGLLLDSENAARDSWMKAANNFGYEFSKDLYRNLIGITRESVKRFLFSAFGPSFPFDEIQDQHRQYLNKYYSEHGPTLKDGARDFLQTISSWGLPCALATSTQTTAAAANMNETGLIPFFQAIVGGEQVTLGKPAPDIFLKAAQSLAIAPPHCVVFEDSRAGVKAAKAAAMHVVMVPDLDLPDDETRALANQISPSLLAALPWLSNALGR